VICFVLFLCVFVCSLLCMLKAIGKLVIHHVFSGSSLSGQCTACTLWKQDLW
jgi:hypothetical protein